MHCSHQQVGSTNLRMVHSHASRLVTSIYPGTGAPFGCDQSRTHPQRKVKKKAQSALDVMSWMSLLVQAQLRAVQHLARED